VKRSKVKTGLRIGIAFAITVVAIVVLAFFRPEFMAIPGTLFVVFAAYTAYTHNARKSGRNSS
jgi:hypothetical protein